MIEIMALALTRGRAAAAVLAASIAIHQVACASVQCSTVVVQYSTVQYSTLIAIHQGGRHSTSFCRRETGSIPLLRHLSSDDGAPSATAGRIARATVSCDVARRAPSWLFTTKMSLRCHRPPAGRVARVARRAPARAAAAPTHLQGATRAPLPVRHLSSSFTTTALHCIALHCIALHCNALHCIALYCAR